jgi:hypothetical protein
MFKKDMDNIVMTTEYGMMESCQSLLVAKLDVGLELQQCDNPWSLILGSRFKESSVSFRTGDVYFCRIVYSDVAFVVTELMAVCPVVASVRISEVCSGVVAYGGFVVSAKEGSHTFLIKCVGKSLRYVLFEQVARIALD